MTNDSIININDLHVRYQDTHAVDGLNLSIGRGEIFGLLGPNGAGKTSTLACIEGLNQPTSGTIDIAGYDVVRNATDVKQLLGVQLQTIALFDELTASELIKLYAAFYNVYPTRKHITALLERFGLGPKASARPKQLSGGQQQRLSLALALVNDPQIVLLDEPTTGLDPQARRGVWMLIRRMQAEGRTVLLTTHYMEEAQELCDRVGIIVDGRLVVVDTPLELIRQHAPTLSPEEASRRQPNLEDVFLHLTGRRLDAQDNQINDDDAMWLTSVAG
ncbi:MAG: ABC-type multidrug transport system, ATPase component [Chloroflexi bacterium AL-W]|nr:ABC-type multidrug transport system, ATPase component [Chloroflexi bacterium AL-N1]NOK71384.1 ABC-type multidrug transport system, ATPase component [Chloroflexi bacterium AL-N10]NOK78787.1 ABC-type multidrug transport system, ATPase component [Chloroflexi bacterium AL-N5]NOK86157.1 ABC-type multidrug transport system, ATPase component [Chloroflexi bacterium AL-W]NOK93110.1 ABC-type multidrug transport system, ATPase component [Chloroflexi bacterium AL-N15]